MHLAFRLFAAAMLGAMVASASADTSIHLTAYPTLSVADGKSTVTVTAEVRDQSGKLAADGTRVVFESTLGDFRESVVSTVGGLARGVLVAGSIAGVSKITVKSLSGDSSPSTLEYEFVGDRSQLSSAREYIEIVAPSYMQYTVDTKIVGAAGFSKTPGSAGDKDRVSVRYREITVVADDIQLNIPTYELRARRAHLKMGGIDQIFSDLYLKLNVRQGYGTTTFKTKRSDAFVTQGLGVAFVKLADDGKLTLPPDESRFGLVEIHRSGIAPIPYQIGSTFNFEDISGSPSTISAKRAVIFPRREIQFQKAQIFVANTKVMSLPLFEVPLMGATSPLVTDQIVGFNNSQLAVNFPYYLALRPGITELLRFQTGQIDGRSATSDRGAFLNYEFNWNRGDDMEGGLAVQGIGRDDWSIAANQYIRFNDRTSAFAQINTPTFRSVFGSSSITEQFNGFSTSLNASASQTLVGIQETQQNLSAVIEKDPIKVGSLPVRLYPGLTAQMSADQLDKQSQSGAGARIRAQSLPLVIDPSTSITGSFTTSYLRGPNELPGLQYLGSVTISKRLNPAASLLFTYDYTRDGFNELALGEHRLSAQASYNKGRLAVSLFGGRSLDLERASLFGDASYKLSNLWRLSTGYTYDRYLSDTYLDYNFAIGYRVGWREVGLIWTAQTKRIGFQLLGVTVY